MAEGYQPSEWSGRGAILATWAKGDEKRGHEALGDRRALRKPRARGMSSAERKAYLRRIGVIK